MKLSVIPAVLVLALAGCSLVKGSEIPSSYMGGLTPTISKDGVHGFTYRVLGKADPDQPAVKAEHEQLISQELGRRQFCGNGYDLVGREKKVEPDSPYYVVTYTARCK